MHQNVILKKTFIVFSCTEAIIGFTQEVYEAAEDVGRARVGVGFLSGEVAVPVTVG